MIRSRNSLRLTQKEKEQLASLSGSDPSHIQTVKQLEDFVKAHLVNFPGRTAEERLLRFMLESFCSKSTQN